VIDELPKDKTFVFGMCPNRHSAGGGGTKFVNYFSEKLVGRASFFINSNEPDPDYILLFDPRHLDFSGNWLSLDVLKEIKARGIKSKIIHRINDIGYPKNRPPEYVDAVIEMANLSDKVIYVSDFVRDYYGDRIKTEYEVIPNGVDERIFTFKEYSFDKLRFVTHHWSSDPMKGKVLYDFIDEMLSDLEGEAEFTYIGNPPKGSNFRRTNVIKPLYGEELANEIKKHNIYVSGSQHEPCGMHKLEGVACGLPIMYNVDSGDSYLTSDYGVGIEYNGFPKFGIALAEMMGNHKRFYDKIVNNFDLYLENRCVKYLEFITK